jgi:hypothetical protein
MKMINQVNIVGHVGAKTELKVFASGKNWLNSALPSISEPDLVKENRNLSGWTLKPEKVSLIEWQNATSTKAKRSPSVVFLPQRFVAGTYGDSHFDIAKVKVEMTASELMSSAKKGLEVEVLLAAYDQEREMMSRRITIGKGRSI